MLLPFAHDQKRNEAEGQELLHFLLQQNIGNEPNEETTASITRTRSESDLRSCKATLAIAKKAQKKFWGFNGIWTEDLRDTGAMLYQLSYEASPEAGQVRVQFIPPLMWREWNYVVII